MYNDKKIKMEIIDNDKKMFDLSLENIKLDNEISVEVNNIKQLENQIKISNDNIQNLIGKKQYINKHLKEFENYRNSISYVADTNAKHSISKSQTYGEYTNVEHSSYYVIGNNSEVFVKLADVMPFATEDSKKVIQTESAVSETESNSESTSDSASNSDSQSDSEFIEITKDELANAVKGQHVVQFVRNINRFVENINGFNLDINQKKAIKKQLSEVIKMVI
jgi:hypothetical protein